MKNLFIIYNVIFLLFGNVLLSNIHYFHDHHHDHGDYNEHSNNEECQDCIIIENSSNLIAGSIALAQEKVPYFSRV